MQPTEHMNPAEDELIAHIKESLSGYEEAYVPGAWENFNKKERKKPLFWVWGLSSAAAAILVLMVFFFTRTTEKLPVQITRTKPAIIEKGIVPEQRNTIDTPADQTAANAQTTLHTEQPAAAAATAAEHHIEQTPVNSGTVAVAAINTNNTIQNPISTTKTAAVNDNPAVVAQANTNLAAVKTGYQKVPVDASIAMRDFLDKESKLNASTKANKLAAKKDNKWEMGVMVAPSFGNTKKLNMGYGVNMAYALSDKISLSSGIAYNEMTGAKSIGVDQTVMNSPTTNAFVTPSKNLESVEARLVGIDIPLEIKYHINKKIYAGVGVSAFAVLNPKRNNTYMEGKVVERSVTDYAAGTQQSKMFFVNERVVEDAPVESEIKDGQYLGFYNFSFGYKQKVSKNNSVAIEPFVKVPMKGVTNENLRLLGTGVRLKFDF
jgi:hypothetical protein